MKPRPDKQNLDAMKVACMHEHRTKKNDSYLKLAATGLNKN